LARKVFRPVGVIFKGSGFHVTDYPKPEDKAKAASEAKAPKPAETGKSGTNDD
jgi:predicted nucleic acid-binding Zn ribbon protein